MIKNVYRKNLTTDRIVFNQEYNAFLIMYIVVRKVEHKAFEAG